MKESKQTVSLKHTSPSHTEKETWEPKMIAPSTEKEGDIPKAIVSSHFLNRHFKRDKAHKPKMGKFQNEKHAPVKFGEKKAYG